MAVPLASAGAILEIRDGRAASSRLKAVKKRNRKNTSKGNPALRYNPANTKDRTSTAPRNTGFMRPFPSA